MIKKIFITFIILLSFNLVSGPKTEEIQNIGLEDFEKVGKWFKDKKIQPRVKVLILEKLNILLLNNSTKINSYSERLLELMEIIISVNKKMNSSYTGLLKKKSCLILSYFNRSNKEYQAYTLMKNTIISESDGEIASTCIRVLGDFNSQKEDLNKFVNEVLKKSLKKKKFDEDDVELALASIEILDKFTMRQSYLTLMKVLSSKYPTEVKNSAKKTLEKIPNP